MFLAILIISFRSYDNQFLCNTLGWVAEVGRKARISLSKADKQLSRVFYESQNHHWRKQSSEQRATGFLAAPLPCSGLTVQSQNCMGYRLLRGPISNLHSSSYQEFYQVNKTNNIPYVCKHTYCWWSARKRVFDSRVRPMLWIRTLCSNFAETFCMNFHKSNCMLYSDCNSSSLHSWHQNGDL